MYTLLDPLMLLLLIIIIIIIIIIITFSLKFSLISPSQIHVFKKQF